MNLIELRKQLEKEIRKLGFMLYDVEFVREKKSDVLRVMIDQPKGVSIDDCVSVSNHLSGYLDELDPIPGEYHLEVTSPGAERTLRNPDEIKLATGRYVHVETYEQKVEGDLLHYDGETLTLRDKHNKQVTFDVIDIVLVRLAIKF